MELQNKQNTTSEPTSFQTTSTNPPAQQSIPPVDNSLADFINNAHAHVQSNIPGPVFASFEPVGQPTIRQHRLKLRTVLLTLACLIIVTVGAWSLAYISHKQKHNTPVASNISQTPQRAVEANTSNTVAQTTTPTKTQPQTQAQTTPTKKATTPQNTNNTNTGSTTTVTPSVVQAGAIPVSKSFGTNYYYAGARQFATTSGMSATLTIAKPSVPVESGIENHSLIELAVGSADGKQYVEVGWIVDPIWFGDGNPHLFVYHWVNGATSCYNGCGFVTISGGTLPGATLTPNTTGTFEISYKSGGWYIYFNSKAVGYFPATLWNNTFTQAGLVQAFGEITLSDNNTNKCIQMGNGKAGTDSTSAAITNAALVGGPTISLSPYYTSPSTYIYGFATQNSLHIGGPGAC